METQELKITRSVKASREAVYKAFTDKEELEKWFCPEGMTAKMNALDVKEGGDFQITMTSDKDASTHSAKGVYKEVSAPEKLVFTWQWVTDEPGEGMETLVTVLLNKTADGTDLEFIHSNFTEEKVRDMHNQGWTSAFNKFDAMFG